MNVAESITILPEARPEQQPQAAGQVRSSDLLCAEECQARMIRIHETLIRNAEKQIAQSRKRLAELKGGRQ